MLEEILYKINALDNRINQICRIGNVSACNYSEALVRVDFGNGVETKFLPWFTHRAGGDQDWHAPEKGEQVMVLCPGGGDHGVVLPAIYQNSFPAPADSPEIHRIKYKDGTIMEYDREKSKHTITYNDGTEFIYDAANSKDTRSFNDGAVFEYDATISVKRETFPNGTQFEYDGEFGILDQSFSDGRTVTYNETTSTKTETYPDGATEIYNAVAMIKSITLPGFLNINVPVTNLTTNLNLIGNILQTGMHTSTGDQIAGDISTMKHDHAGDGGTGSGPSTGDPR